MARNKIWRKNGDAQQLIVVQSTYSINLLERNASAPTSRIEITCNKQVLAQLQFFSFLQN